MKMVQLQESCECKMIESDLNGKSFKIIKILKNGTI